MKTVYGPVIPSLPGTRAAFAVCYEDDETTEVTYNPIVAWVHAHVPGEDLPVLEPYMYDGGNCEPMATRVEDSPSFQSENVEFLGIFFPGESLSEEEKLQACQGVKQRTLRRKSLRKKERDPQIASVQ